MLVIPAIDLKDGRCVRLMQGRKSDVTVYDDDAVERARRFEADGALRLHVVDLDGAFAGGESPNREVARRIIRAVNVPVQFGGGLRSAGDIEQLIEYGAAQVVIGTLAVESPEMLQTFVELFGSRIAVGIDARNGYVTTHAWERDEAMTALELARRVVGAGVDRIIYTDVARDGMLQGINIEQTCALARATGLRVTASGGVSSLADIETLRDACESGIDSVIVGKALYEGRFTLQEAIQSSTMN